TLAEFSHERRRSTVLPNDRGSNCTPRARIPNYGCFTLVRDAYCCDVGGRQAVRAQQLFGHNQLTEPDLLGILLDPARPGIVLGKLALLDRPHLSGIVEENRTGTGGALVES